MSKFVESSGLTKTRVDPLSQNAEGDAVNQFSERANGDYEKRILRYWKEVLSRPNWKGMLGETPFFTCNMLEELQDFKLPPDDLSRMSITQDESLVVHVVATSANSQTAFFAIRAHIDTTGQIAPPTDAPYLLLNPDFFVLNESSRGEKTIGLAEEFFHANQNVAVTSWPEYVYGFKLSFENCGVDIERPATNGGRRPKIQWRVLPDQGKVDGTVQSIVNRYDNLLNTSVEQWPLVFRNLLRRTPLADKSDVTKSTVIAHVDSVKGEKREVWPLDQTQRLAATKALSLIEGQSLAVHGPPGTGKTTFLRSLIASMWVQPLLKGDVHSAYPPIILGAAPTNESAQNMMAAFDSAIADESGYARMDTRFIPGHRTYGWYFPAKTKADKITRPSLVYRDKHLVYELAGEHLKLLTSTGVGEKASRLLELESQYVARASVVLQRSFRSLREALDALAVELRQLYVLSQKHDNVLQEWLIMSPKPAEVREDVRPPSGGVQCTDASRKTWIRRFTQWLLRRKFEHEVKSLKEPYCNEDINHEAGQFLDRVLIKNVPSWWKDVINSSEIQHAREQLYRHANESSDSWGETAQRLWEEYGEITLKPAIFHAAARIWEGRWIEVMQENTNERSLDDEMKIAAMIAPFTVATINRLPFLSNHQRMREKGFADLILLDEAGQASIEKAGASLSCGKRLVAVGDSKQLQPVWSVTKPEDEFLQRKYGLEHLHESLTISAGHALATVSQSSISQRADGVSGVQLLFHYRCLTPIIEYCNHLSYEGQLVPCRPMPDKLLPWPAISFVLTDETFRHRAAEATSVNGWQNVEQAQEIALWLSEERTVLEKSYKTSIDNIVAVITPFSAQVDVLRKELRAVLGDDIAGHNRMVIGTVNALQGMERPIVVFSSVVTDAKRSVWLNGNPNLVNVAVSRARDSFVVFGDQAVLFETPAVSPLALLGQHIDRYGQMLYPKDLIIVEAPGKREKIQEALGRRHFVVATGGHIRTLPNMKTDIDWHNPPWEVKNESFGVVERLQNYVHILPYIVLATDDDREGEAIAWHVMDELSHRGIVLTAQNVRRMRFSSLAPETLKRSYELAGHGLDMNRVRAALTRDIVDYLIGQRYSRSLDNGIGRVTSALLLEGAKRTRQKPTYRITVGIALDSDTGELAKGYIVENRTSVARPILVLGEEDQRYLRLKEDLLMSNVTDLGIRRILREGQDVRVPATIDILLFLAEHGISPWEAMTGLQELYEGGSLK